MIRETAILLLSVLIGAITLGTGSAWIVSAYDFPFRRVLGWLLVAPLAIPGYVGGFVWLDTLTGVFGARGVRSLWLCAAVLTVSLYPYVYLFARAAFADLRNETVAAARSLGAGPLSLFIRVALPTARPAIAAGSALVAMEVLTDIGTVRLFNVSTLADGVMRVWFGTGNRNAATELASALTGIAILVIGYERLTRRGSRHSTHRTDSKLIPSPLTKIGTLRVLTGVMTVVVVAVMLPISRLAGWTLETLRENKATTVAGGISHHTWNSLLLALIAAFLCLLIGTVLALTVSQMGRLAHGAGRLATLGYAMPGPVVAVGVVVLLAAIDRRSWFPDGFILVGSWAGLVFALVARFMAISYQGVEAGLAKVPRAAKESARVLGAGPVRVALAIELPAVRFGLLAATALLFIDIIKELPITLLLRPFGVDTLSVWVWQSTSESLWAQAAVPSLIMVGIGMAAVGSLLFAIERGAGVVS